MGTKKMALNSQIVMVKENPQLSHGGRTIDKHQALAHWWKFYVGVVIESEAWPAVVQLKRKP